MSRVLFPSPLSKGHWKLIGCRVFAKAVYPLHQASDEKGWRLRQETVIRFYRMESGEFSVNGGKGNATSIWDDCAMFAEQLGFKASIAFAFISFAGLQ